MVLLPVELAAVEISALMSSYRGGARYMAKLATHGNTRPYCPTWSPGSESTGYNTQADCGVQQQA